MKTSFHFIDKDVTLPDPGNTATISIPSASGGQVDASCNTTVTVTCLKELYNAVGYTPLGDGRNQIAATGYLDQFANFADLQLFYQNQVPAAVNTSFKVVPINGELLVI